ncbi:MAG: hypothetical protein ACI9XO_000929 [Paraglaciecola sp.]|jgi:hypothetical protein
MMIKLTYQIPNNNFPNMDLRNLMLEKKKGVNKILNIERVKNTLSYVKTEKIWV